MMTILSILFLIASFPFQGIALAAKTASVAAKTGKIAITPKVHQAKVKKKSLLKAFKKKKKVAKKSTALLESLEKTKGETSKARVLKHKKLDTKIATLKPKVTKDKADVKQTEVKSKAASTNETVLKRTKQGLQLTEITQNALHLAASGVAMLLKGISSVFSLLIPIDVYITLAVLVLVVISGVVSVIYTNGGIADPNVNTEQEAGKDDIYVDEEGNIIENPEFDEDDNIIQEDPYKKVEDSGWIILAQEDERWGSTSITFDGGTSTIADSSLGSFFTCLAMIHTKLDTSSVITPDKVVTMYDLIYADPDKLGWFDTMNSIKDIDNSGSENNIKILSSFISCYANQKSLNLNVTTQICYGGEVTGFINESALSVLDDNTIGIFPVYALGSSDGYDTTWSSKYTDSERPPHFIIVYRYNGKLRVLSPNINHEDASNTQDGDVNKKPYSTMAFEVGDFAKYSGHWIMIDFN